MKIPPQWPNLEFKNLLSRFKFKNQTNINKYKLKSSRTKLENRNGESSSNVWAHTTMLHTVDKISRLQFF